MARLFGTDGVRGIAGSEITPELAYKLGRAAVRALTGRSGGRAVITIGKDTRISSDMLESAMAAGICSAGGDAMHLGVIPTPAVAYLTKAYGGSAGVVISASHNPFDHNGIKIFDGEGFKLQDDIEDEIEALIRSDDGRSNCGDKIGRVLYPKDPVGDYIRMLYDASDVVFDGFKVVIDCANGAASSVIDRFVRQFSLSAEVINANPSGVNINESCGSTNLDGLMAEVKKRRARLGIAFDGDADRLMAVDENGDIIDGDKLIGILARDMKKNGSLRNNAVVVTTMTNLGFFEMARNEGFDVVTTGVGDRYVLREMLQGNYSIGGEQSGHIILRDFSTTGDGMLAAVRLINIMYKNQVRASELSSIMEKYPQVLLNVGVSPEYKEVFTGEGGARVDTIVEKYRNELADKGRIVVRASGTEPLIRVMVEGRDFSAINRLALEIAEFIKEENVAFISV